MQRGEANHLLGTVLRETDQQNRPKRNSWRKRRTRRECHYGNQKRENKRHISLFTAKQSSILRHEKFPSEGHGDLFQISFCAVIVSGVYCLPLQGVTSQWGATLANTQPDVSLSDPKGQNLAFWLSHDDTRKKITE